MRVPHSISARTLLLVIATGIHVAALESSAFAQAPTVSVSLVGCASDGQTGPIDAPKGASVTLHIPALAADRLALYASGDIAVLAPKGWHCFGLYGSNGALLIVTPEKHGGNDLQSATTSITGPAVILRSLSGGTSGRFEVARIASRMFPIARSFVKGVIDEGIEPAEDFPSTPYPNDILTRHSDTIVEFVTPANSEGLGTLSGLKKVDEQINGVVILEPENDMNLTQLSVRLPAAMNDLRQVIAANIDLTQRPSCSATAGSEAATTYARQCLMVSPATHPPCNVRNPCNLIIGEIKRGCQFIHDGLLKNPELGQEPAFCGSYSPRRMTDE